jgi:hypothetical protein
VSTSLGYTALAKILIGSALLLQRMAGRGISVTRPLWGTALNAIPANTLAQMQGAAADLALDTSGITLAMTFGEAMQTLGAQWLSRPINIGVLL